MNKHTQTNVLASFINEEEDCGNLIKNASNNLEELYHLMHYHGVDKEKMARIRTLARQHLTVTIDSILSKKKNLTDLAEIYADRYWEERDFGPKIVSRMKELYAHMTIEELMSFRQKFCLRFSAYAFMRAANDSIIELLKTDVRRTQFQFLLDVWNNLCISVSPDNGQGILETVKEIEQLMPPILALENDLPALYRWREESCRKNWDWYKNPATTAVAERIKEITIALLPGTTDALVIEKYLSAALDPQIQGVHSGLYYNPKTYAKIEERLAEVVAVDIAAMKLDELIEYKEKLRLSRHERYPKTEQVLKDRLEAILPIALQNMTSAENVYPYLKQVYEYYFGSYIPKDAYYNADTHPHTVLVIDRIIELAPGYFKKRNTLKTALDWYRYTGSEKVRNALCPIIETLINKEWDAELLATFNGEERFQQQAQRRFGIVLKKMRSKPSWFEQYIERSFFFGNKQIFLEKAKEFAGV